MTRRFDPALLPFMLLLAILPFPGTVALRLLCLAAAFAYAVYAWKRLAVPPIPFKPVLAVWALTALASLSYSVDPAYSLGEIKNELGYAMMTFVAFFAISGDENRVRSMLLALACGALLLCFGALAAQFIVGVWGLAGWYGGIAAYATYLATALPAVVLLGFYYRNTMLRNIVLLLLVVMIATGFYSSQRIVWPVLLLQACVALVFFRKKLSLDAFRIAVIFCILTALVVTILWVVEGKIYERRLIERVPINQIDKDERIVLWSTVSTRIMEHPLTGAGFGRRIMSKAYPDLIPANNGDLWHAHNVVLNYGLYMGLPGIVVILVLFGAMSWQYLRFWRVPDQRLKLLGACGIAMIVGVLARNMVNDLFLRDGALLFWALNGIFLGLGLRLTSVDAVREKFERDA